MEHTLECIVAIGIKTPRDLCARHEPIEAVEGAWIHMQARLGHRPPAAAARRLCSRPRTSRGRPPEYTPEASLCRSVAARGSSIGRHICPTGLTAKVGSPAHQVIFSGPHKRVWNCRTGRSNVAVVDHGIDEQLKGHLHFSPITASAVRGQPRVHRRHSLRRWRYVTYSHRVRRYGPTAT